VTRIIVIDLAGSPVETSALDCAVGKGRLITAWTVAPGSVVGHREIRLRSRESGNALATWVHRVQFSVHPSTQANQSRSPRR